LVAESRSLVMMNASINFAPSGAKKVMNVIVRKAKRFLPKRLKHLVLGILRSLRWPHEFDLQVSVGASRKLPVH
jgi:hypothetical protein